MDIQAYISSGILETYLMGLASPQEAQEVETLAVKFPAIRIELTKIENAISEYALLNSVTPPFDLRDKVFAAITASENGTLTKGDAKIVDFKSAKSSGESSGMKWYAAAASIALFASLTYNYTQFQQTETEKLNALAAVDSINNVNLEIQKQLSLEKETALKNIALLTQPGNKLIEMKGLEISPSSSAMILYNEQTKQAYLSVKSLPPAAADKQYQLWAIVDGKPVDMGVFDVNTDSASLQKMMNIENPQAFAVTLEQKGGSLTPTLEQMYVMGKNG